MSQAIEKRCRICGTDVANQKRTKDTAGNYYCQPCYSAAPRGTTTPSPDDAEVSIQSKNPVAMRPKSPLVRRAEWTLLVGVTALLVLIAAATVFSGDIGGRDGKVVIPTLIGGALGFIATAYSAMWLAKHGQEIKKQGGFSAVFSSSDRIAFAGKVVGGLIIAASLPIWILSQSGVRRSTEGTPAAPIQSSAPTLPSIHIEDESNQMTFSNWQVEGYNLTAVMVSKGPRKIDSLTYTLRRNGVVVRRGDVSVPGGMFKTGEANEVTILCWEEPTALDVTIHVGY